MWSLFSKKLIVIAKSGDYRAMSDIYYSQANFLVKEGKNPYEMLHESKKMELLDYKKQGLKKVEISWSGNACDSCKKLDGKTMTINKAIKSMPLPNKNCSMDVFGKGVSWCRCIYLPQN